MRAAWGPARIAYFIWMVVRKANREEVQLCKERLERLEYWQLSTK